MLTTIAWAGIEYRNRTVGINQSLQKFLSVLWLSHFVRGLIYRGLLMAACWILFIQKWSFRRGESCGHCSFKQNQVWHAKPSKTSGLFSTKCLKVSSSCSSLYMTIASVEKIFKTAQTKVTHPPFFSRTGQEGPGKKLAKFISHITLTHFFWDYLFCAEKRSKQSSWRFFKHLFIYLLTLS